jgi:CDP-diacylglycerol--serine O-phosphatidyltransferase
MSIKNHVPNAITCLNLFSGCIAVVMAFRGLFFYALLFVILAAVFDFFDGFAARLLHASSPIGKELDSLADMVSFGVAPSVVVFTQLSWLDGAGKFLPFGAFLIAVFSALRLAKFNVDDRQTTSFIGLATPANALFFMGLFAIVDPLTPVASYLEPHRGLIHPILFQPAVVMLLVVFFSCLLVSEIPMFSLKFKNLHYKDNALRYIFLAGCIILIIWMKSFGFALSILWYILLCLLHLILKKS